MDPVDFLDNEELLQFFHRKKTEMSLMENPHTFLSQLRDYRLIPSDSYKKVSRMKSKDNVTKAVYEILDRLEREHSQHIDFFWKCVFNETILNQYPTLQRLRKSLMDGSYRFDAPLPETVKMKESDKGERKELSEDEEKQPSSVKKKRKRRSTGMCSDDEEEQSSSSSQLTPRQKKKSKKICFSSPLKKGEKSDIWTWPIYKSQLPVTCGHLEAILQRDRLAKGEKCIVYENQWFTPGEFEKFAGKESSRNWKCTIRCVGTTLGKLLQEGHLKTACFRRGSKKTKKSLLSAELSTTESEGGDKDEDEEGNLEDPASSSNQGSVSEEEEEMEEEDELQPEANLDRSKKVFKVTCGALTGTLHAKRFASGTCGKSIRTETSWMTPLDFTKEAWCQADVSWKKEIKCEGKPLSVLIEERILPSHSLLCTCNLCRPDPKDLKNEENDDECCICKSEEEEELVVCDHCPRSFHQRCHLPHVEDTILKDDRAWMCTFCIFRTVQACRYSDDLQRDAAAAMSRQTRQHMLECQYLLLCLCSADENQEFATNPGLDLNDYSSIIETPMWLQSVADKLQQNQYQTVGEFVSDIQLIFTNCATYNRDNAEFLAMGNQLKQLFDEEFKKAFNICEQTVDG